MLRLLLSLGFAFCCCFHLVIGVRWKHLTGEGNGPKTTYSQEEEASIIRLLPKVELHAHLHGSIRYTTILDFIHSEIELEKEKTNAATDSSLNVTAGQKPAISSELQQWLNAEKKVTQLTLQYADHGNSDKPFEIFPIIHRIIKRRDQVERILKEMINDYMQEKTQYLEIRTTPRPLADGTTMREYVELLVKTIYDHNQRMKTLFHSKITNDLPTEKSENDHQMLVKLILSVDRGRKAIEANDIIEIAQSLAYFPIDPADVNSREKVIVAIDFSGNPLGGRFYDFEIPFSNARNLGFNLTVHAAEVKELSTETEDRQDETSFILDFRPDRLGHMLYLQEKHFKKLSQLNHDGIAPLIEICPSTSFYMMGLKSFADHPHIRRLQSLHYPFSLNTDDSGIFNTTISNEILHMKTAVKLSIYDIAHSEVMSLQYAFIPDESEKKLVRSLFWSNIEKLVHDYPHSGLESLDSNDGKNAIDMSSLYTL